MTPGRLAGRVLALAAVALAVAGCGASKSGEARVERELERLQGTWRRVSDRINGVDLPGDEARAMSMTLAGNRKIIDMGGRGRVETTFEIDPSVDPMRLDETFSTGQDRPPTLFRGIYRLDGDTLTRCSAAANRPAPKAFASKPGSVHSLQVFRRVAAGEPPREK